MRYICTNCGYIYDPQTGDAAQGIPEHTEFEDIPESWHCPLCYRGKDVFDPYD